MRIWSLHPKFLDAKGLVALWRETLLAQKVLQGNTSGYRNHPQLERFREQKNPVVAVATYLRAVVKEADERGYSFDASKISEGEQRKKIPVSDGQLQYEFEHLLRKLQVRDAERFALFKDAQPECHPLFEIVKGEKADWEK